MFYTIDDYYNVDFYNECLVSLNNNQVNYQEFVLLNNNPKFYLKLDNAPFIINYEELKPEHYRYLVTKVNPLDIYSENNLKRKSQDVSLSIRKELYINDALSNITDFAAFINIPSVLDGLRLSKEVPLKIYYLGKYINGIKLGLITSPLFLPFINPNNVLLIKEENESITKFEQRLNLKILQKKSYLIKFSSTPYFKENEFIKPKNQIDPKFIVL